MGLITILSDARELSKGDKLDDKGNQMVYNTKTGEWIVKISLRVT